MKLSNFGQYLALPFLMADTEEDKKASRNESVPLSRRFAVALHQTSEITCTKLCLQNASLLVMLPVL